MGNEVFTSLQSSRRIGAPALAEMHENTLARPSSDGNLDVRWIHGSASAWHPTDPPIQVHPYDSRTYILRESKDVSWEAPFLYLLFGSRRALLLDTGATPDPNRFPLRATVDGLMANWLVDHPRPEYELVVAHSHGHGDHVAGDPQFTGRPHTRVVGRDVADVRGFFGLNDWPEGVREFDLGDRALAVFGIPGHQAASIAIYDPPTGLLLTGDTVYPGRLYVRDMPAFLGSVERMVRFASTRPVTYLMGGHIEMTREPGRDYPIATRYQPQELPLPMHADRLEAVRAAAASVRDRPGVHAFDDFLIYNGPCTGASLRGLIRGKIGNVRRWLPGASG
jgi:hydroxyacylglutathione hydrolase